MIYLYEYYGPVMNFGTCIDDKWFGRTYAKTEKKARSNLAYQYKKTHGYTKDFKIYIPGELTIVEN